MGIVPAEHCTSAECERGVNVLALAFFGIFAGFGATQALQSSLNATLGFINLACLYVFFVIVGLICTPLVSIGIDRCGWRWLLVISAATYVVMILSNLVTGPCGFWIQPIANMLLGAGAAFLWTVQNEYLGQCAAHAGTEMAKKDGESSTRECISRMATKFNSNFFGVFQFAQMFSCLVSSVVMLAFAGNSWLRNLLFVVLSAATVCGTISLLLLPNIPRAGEASIRSPSVMDALRVVFTPRFGLLFPWIMTNGMTVGFAVGDLPSDVVSPLLGPGYVGLIIALFFATDSVFTRVWGTLIASQHLSRRMAFVVTSALWIMFFFLKSLRVFEPNFEKDGSDWRRIGGASTTALDCAFPMGLAIIAGAADGFWMPGPPAILQSIFAETPQLLPAMAAYKSVQSLGFATQFILGATLSAYPNVRGFLLIALCAFSLASVLTLDRVVQPLDIEDTMLKTPLNIQP